MLKNTFQYQDFKKLLVNNIKFMLNLEKKYKSSI